MEPTTDEALVDLVDVLLRDGAVLRADVIVTVADVPLIGISLSAAIAGMETMNKYGMFTEWDGSMRANAIARRQYAEDGRPRHRAIPSRERVATAAGERRRPGPADSDPEE
ncbi:gas vesicle protein GvpA [Halovivax asiaticus JCM 14624]|uniref:Gas vesicle protein GvpA n=1 Tax=Halovivax asiaticus JCM 14624 TaxID=1227490 RepID=M0BDS5_9EURY|nr:gas vesicle protein [Halovivax asiaticus]ELZ08637.1 gas vesicle protein GvpA [Halovivax asiaticus JCM 14624]